MNSNNKKEMNPEEKKQFSFVRKNFYIIITGVVLVIIGYILMGGDPSTEEFYNPDIFSFRRIVLAPGISLLGFFVVLFGIIFKTKK